MGILQSVMQYLNDDTDLDDEDSISSRKSKYILTTSPSRQWQKTNCPTRSHQNTFLLHPPLETSGYEEEIGITLPHQWQQRGNRPTPTGSHHLRTSSSSLAYKSVNDNKVEENVRRPREEVPARMAAEVRWMMHYSSQHWILLVGEGDFSFSASLAIAFGSASNMVATSLDSQEFLLKNYKNALFNLLKLQIRKCILMHEINATEMATHPLLGGIKFDRIIFNFPFAGFFKDLPRVAQLRVHRRLVSGFLENAKRMLRENGEIHITHNINGFFKEWKVEALASLHKLRAVEVVEFNNTDYPGYNTKYGFGGDRNFNCNPSMIYKFRI